MFQYIIGNKKIFIVNLTINVEVINVSIKIVPIKGESYDGFGYRSWNCVNSCKKGA